MNFKMKPFILASFSSLALSCTINHAMAADNTEPTYAQFEIVPQELAQHKVLLVNQQINYLFEPKSRQKTEFNGLVKLDSNKIAEYMPLSSNSNKGNRLFELATLFNDKLQQILSFFHSGEKSQSSVTSSAATSQPEKSCHQING